MQDIHSERILILDFGSQYTQLVARRVREQNVYCEIWAWDVRPSLIVEWKPCAVILSGGPESVIDEGSPRCPQEVLDLEVPVLGVCYGLQTLSVQLGGRVENHEKKEFGFASVEKGEFAESQLLDGCFDSEGRMQVWMSHGDQVTEVPAGWRVTGQTSTCPYAAVEHPEKGLYGVQFHPEVTHSKMGMQMISNFIHKICGITGSWNPANIVDDAVTKIRNQVGSDSVILGISGGVDSSVAAALLSRAIGDQLKCIFVDNGLLRKNEGVDVMEMFKTHGVKNVTRVDAEDRFLTALKGVDCPETKRKIIGRVFVEIFDEEACKVKDATFLAQGTIYPDVIESAGAKTGKAHVIKSHHNVGGLPEHMKLTLCEPLKELFKDEVRAVGIQLGLPAELVYRHPFPGPGLGVRVLGEVTKERCDILREADHIFISEMRKWDLYDKCAQAFAVFVPSMSVGVTGDGRRYAPVIALRAVETIDFMTARWARLPYDFLDHCSLRIVNEIENVSRVVYDISGKPPATIEWE